MDKQSTIKMAQVIHDTRLALTSVTAERDKLAAENAAYKRREEATKVASVLHDKGIHRDVEFSDLVANLEKEAAAGHLGEIARAADMIGPNMTFGTPQSDAVVSGGSHAFEDFLVGSVG
jgi:hypothetical protein